MNESMKKENNKEELQPEGKGVSWTGSSDGTSARSSDGSWLYLNANAGRRCGISGSEQIVMIQASLLGAAIAIFLQHYPLKGLVGSGLPVMIGSGFAFLPTLSSIVGQYGIAAMLGCSGIRRSDGHYCRHFL